MARLRTSDGATERGSDSALGARLRAAREKRGIEREAAAVQARIPLRYVAMLEEGRFPTVADPAYLTHFLRRYAEHLGIDPEIAARDFLNETEPEAASRRIGRTSPAGVIRRGPGIPRGLPPRWALYAGFLLAMLAAVFMLVRFEQQREARAPARSVERVAGRDAEPGLPEREKPAVAVPSSAAPEPAAETGRGGDANVSAVPAPLAAEPEQDVAPAPRPQVPAESPPTPLQRDEPSRVAKAEPPASVVERKEPAASPPQKESGAETAVVSAPPIPPREPAHETAKAPPADQPPPVTEKDRSRQLEPPFELRLTATSRQVWVWVSVDGGPEQAVSLNRGESALFRAGSGYVVSVDDAGGVQATLNGEALPRFGRAQQVRKNVVIPSNEFGGRKGRPGRV